MACDLDAVDRIERGICYAIEFKGSVDQPTTLRARALLFDRMTEAVLARTATTPALFERTSRRRSARLRWATTGATRSSRPTSRSAWRCPTTRSTTSSRTTARSSAIRPTPS